MGLHVGILDEPWESAEGGGCAEERLMVEDFDRVGRPFLGLKPHSIIGFLGYIRHGEEATYNAR